MKYINAVREHFVSRPVFSIRDVKVFLNKQGPSDAYIYLLAHHLTKRGEIRRLTRGIYTFRKEAEVTGFAFSPFYYGLQDALSFRNIWEQETNSIIITPRRVRSGQRTIAGTKTIVRRINRRMFFGFNTIRFHDLYLPVSDVEKTLIDFIYFREPLRKDVLKTMRGQIREDVLKSYLKRTPDYVKVALNKLGFV